MLSERIKSLKAYVPGEQPQDRKYIKLNTNESPYPPSPLINNVLREFDFDRLRLYPDPLAKRLREKIAEVYGVRTEQVFVANGSDEALSFCFYAFFDAAHGKVLFPEFTYSFYPVYCNFYGIPYEKVPLGEDYVVDVDGFLRMDSCGIIFANPNAPTGISLPLERIESLLGRYPQENAVLVDEAYVDFGAESALGLLNAHRNLVVIRTFSKSMSLAGLRLGFVVAHESLIEALFRVKDSFNSYPVDTLTQMMGEIALSDESYYRAMREKIILTRERFSQRLREMGWLVLPSKTNFVFATKEGITGLQVYRTLREKGILVRHFDTKGIEDFVRITIGTDGDMETLLKAIKSYL
jgi:histidinol-phosphate aminotransferase